MDRIIIRPYMTKLRPYIFNGPLRPNCGPVAPTPTRTYSPAQRAPSVVTCLIKPISPSTPSPGFFSSSSTAMHANWRLANNGLSRLG
uniref:Uncharacterized protein n=1 Tax=Romanomermis culicivorax TaxID=13658 RepID=A0A915KLM7_ROMCU